MSKHHSRAARRARAVVIQAAKNAWGPVCEPLEVRQMLSFSISGSVWNDANANGVHDGSEPAFAGVTVTVNDESGNTVATTTTDDSGNYSVSGLPAGEWLAASADVPGFTLYDNGSGTVSSGAEWFAGYDDTPASIELAELRALPAPTNLSAVAASGSEVDLSWTSNSASTESGFHVYESVNGGAFSSTPVATTGTNVTSCAITGLDSSNDYVFEVAAYDANGDSYLSATADANVPTPTNVDTTAVLDNSGNASVEVDWTPGANTPTGTTYNVYRSTDGSMPTTPYVTGVTSTSFSDTSVSPGATYFYSVRAVSDASFPGAYTASSGSGSSGQTGVPTIEGTVSYVRYASALANSMGNNSYYPGGPNVYPIPPFNTSLGTETGGQVEYIWADAATFIDGPPSVAEGDYAFELLQTSADGSEAWDWPGVLDSGGLRYGGTTIPQIHTTTGDCVTGIPATGFIGVQANDQIWAGGDNEACSMQAAIAGSLITTYTFSNTAPSVTTGPTDQTAAAGTDATFTADASGFPAPAVQWQKSTDGGATWTAIPGATSTTYSFTASGSDSGSEYEAVFTNSQGTATSSPATLNVTPTWLSSDSAATWNASTQTLTVTGGTTIIADPGADEPIIAADGSSAAVVVALVNPIGSGDLIHIGGVELSDGASLTVQSVGSAREPGNHEVLVIGALGAVNDPTIWVDSSSKIDLEDNDMIVHTGSSDTGATDAQGYTETNELGAVAGLAAQGRNVAPGGAYDGTWTGNGLTSSSAASIDAAAGYEQNILAVEQSSDMYLGGYANWTVGVASEELGANDIIVKYTYNGDLNLDGMVDDESTQILSHFYDDGATSGNLYAYGDLNGDGLINGTDAGILARVSGPAGGNGQPGSGLDPL